MKTSIAIPAFNEEERLPRLLALLREEAGPRVTEILVCDSLSSDSTAAVARQAADSRVRALSAESPGKPAAWNTLIRAAREPVVVFLDADVLPAPGCLERLIQRASDSPRRILHGGRRSAVGPGWLRTLADPVIELSLAGGCYAVRRTALLDRMSERGFTEMPDVLAEDVWLQSLLKRHEFAIADACVFEFEIRSLDAYLRIQARKRLTAYEFDERFPALGRSLRAHFPEAVDPWAQLHAAVRTKSSLRRRLAWVAAAAVKASVNVTLRGRVQQKYEAFRQGYRRHGGGYVLRRLASSGLRP